ncbi:hypothetical protein Tco_0288566, partial [Tanacetum coccineum]
NQQEKKRKSQEFNAYYLVMKSSKEQEILEAVAFHLILLSKPLRQSHLEKDIILMRMIVVVVVVVLLVSE